MNPLDIFYNHIVKEATKGKINCYLYYNILFETEIKESNTLYLTDKKDLVVPRLIITNKELFDNLLLEYLNLALAFYDDSNFIKKVLEKEEYKESGVCKEKVILTLLWSNATIEDFENPIKYLQKRIDFLVNSEVKHDNLGYSNTVNGNVLLDIKKEKIQNETPNTLAFSFENNKELFYLPEVRYGISNDSVYIYAIQNEEANNNSYSKKVNRVLYKVNDRFPIKEETFEKYEEGNLKDITSSFLVSLSLAISYFNSLGYKHIIANNMLISRWNAKEEILENKKYSTEEREELYNKFLRIQNNLTQKFIRTFLRLKSQYNGIDITKYPDSPTDNLELEITDYLVSNNKLLEELTNIVNSNYLQREDYMRK